MSSNTLAFWPLTNFTDTVISINGSNINKVVGDLPRYDARFAIVLDDTGVNVLIMRNTDECDLLLSSAGVQYSISGSICEFIGQKPHRPK